VTPLPVIHGKVETNGFLFSRNDQKLFAYIPDAKILTAETKSHLAGIDLLVLDGLQPERHQTHLSISESLALIKELEVKQAWLTHFSCRMNYKTLEPTLPQRVGLAWDGLKICL
jgi:phosphoribosyl 1,2-cyclic phosphate phosphodiesterase